MTLTINDVEYAFRWCPPGTFMMGSPKDEKDRDYASVSRLPEDQHQVTLTRGFWMLETEVTQEMWTSMMGNNPDLALGASGILSILGFKGTKFPMAWISWNDCQEYIKKLNDLGVAPAGFKFSLPTEAQWEYACRAGTTTAYHFGDTLRRDQANFGPYFRTPGEFVRAMEAAKKEAGYLGKPTEVGRYPANAWGLHDMHGNVQEYCLDYHGEYPSGAVTDPVGVPSEKFKEVSAEGTTFVGPFVVVRGGAFNYPDCGCRSAYRGHTQPGQPCAEGLRLALIRVE